MTDRTNTPSCPRCGYDQSGAVTTWTDRCPVSGTCPECGTGFLWADLFDPSRRDIRWLVEHARTDARRLRRTGPTLVRAALPWVFWRRVDVQARTSPRALLRWLLFVLVLMHLASWLPFSVLFAAMDNGYGPSLSELSRYVRDASGGDLINALLTGLTWPLASFYAWRPTFVDFYGGRELLAIFRVPLGIGLTWAIVMTALPVTRRAARLRRAHVLCALLVQWAVVLIALGLFRLAVPLVSLTASLALGVTAAGFYLAVCVWSLVWWVSALWAGWRVRSVGLAILGTVAAALGGVVASVIEMSVSYFLAP